MEELTLNQVVEKAEFEVRIDDFGFKGEGYVRLDDGWLSVPGALPKEVVRLRVQPGQNYRGRRLFADVVEVIEPSSDRRDPLCGHDEICRGCQLRHLTVASELEFKVRTVREVMERYAGLKAEAQPQIGVVTPQPVARGDAFRIRTRLTFRRRGPDFELGLRSPVHSELIPMDRCPAVVGPVQRLVATVRESLSGLEALPWDDKMVRQVQEQVDGIDVGLAVLTIEIAAPVHGVGLVDIQLSEAADEEHLERQLAGPVFGPWLERLVEMVPSKVGVGLRCGEFRRYLSGVRRIEIPIGRWQMEVGFDDWFHATLEPAEQVYEVMLRWLGLDGEDRVIDIGCGTGTISLMCSETAAEVVGVDANPASIEAAQINAINHGADNTRFVVGGWEKSMRELAMSGDQFSSATINPMREPLGRRPLAFLEVLGVEQVVYLGPSPEAAAKDIGLLREMGWQVRRLASANLHPATYHTMLMAKLVQEER